MHSPWIAAPALGPSECLLDLYVAEAVDEWVEGWDDKGVEYRCHLVTLQGIAGAGIHVDENKCPVQNVHSCEVGATGRGCLPVALA